MGHNSSVAASLKPKQRKQLFIEMQSSPQTITASANREGVSRKFLYQRNFQIKKSTKALSRGAFIDFERPGYWVRSL